MTNAPDCAAAIRQGLSTYGIEVGESLFIKYCRVGASDAIGQITGAELVCMLVGERPGLTTAESMSAYITYKPYPGIPEAKRTVVSNIHRQGTPAVEAGDVYKRQTLECAIPYERQAAYWSEPLRNRYFSIEIGRAHV